MERNGFTLVELMVAIALLGLIAGAVVLTVGTPGGGPRKPAMRFATRLAAARDQAILSGQPMSVWVAPSGYGFERMHGGFWERTTDKPFDGRDWPEGTAVALTAGSEVRARVRFDSLGLPDQAGSFRLTSDGQATTVRLSANGDVRVD